MIALLRLLSLKTRITLLTLGLFWGAIWGLAYDASRDLRHGLQEILSDQQLVTVSHIASSIGDAVRIRIESLTMIADSIRPEWLADAGKVKDYLRDRRAIYKLFNGGLICIAANGMAVADQPHLEKRVESTFVGLEFFDDVLRTGRPVIAKPRIGRASGQPVINMGVPIRGASGEVVGVLAGVNSILGTDVFSQVAPSRLGGVGDIHVISLRDGLIVTSTDRGRLLQPLSALGLDALVERYRQGTEGSVVAVNGQGVEELSSARRIDETGWMVVGTLPATFAFAPIADLQRHLYLEAALVSLVVGALVWLFLYREIVPLGRYAATLRDMTGGAAPLRVLPVKGSPEVRVLLEAFNRLTARLCAQEDTLRQSEERYRSLVNSQPDIVARVDRSGNFTFVNDAACTQLGRSPEGLLGTPWSDYILAGDIAATAAALQLILDGQRRRHATECRVLTTDGPRWVSFDGFAILDADGGLREVQVTGHDISERRKAGEDLLFQLALLKALIEAIPAAVFYKDEQLRYIGFNRCFEALIGLPAESILGKTVYDVVPKPNADAYHDSDCRVLASRQSTSYNFTMPVADGSERHMRTHKAMFDKADGSPGGIIGITLDITADVRHETELLAAREAAEEANQAKSRFLAAMSHELRTPLNAILGFSEIMRDGTLFPQLGERGREYVGYIHSSGRHLLDLINDILDISKIEAGNMQIDPTRVPTASAVDGACRMLRERAERNGLTVRIEVEAEIPDLWADPRAVKQILYNLLSNAIKFTPRGGSVTVTAASAAAGAEVLLVVADTGSGIPVDQMDRVLKPFEQLDNRYTRARGGTGLGLSLVQGLVGLHGGRLTIESEIGVGSTVSVALPAAPVEGFTP